MEPCPFCKKQPVVHRHGSAPADSGLAPGAWAQIECQSPECANRIVKTHRCGNEAEAVKAWEFGRG